MHEQTLDRDAKPTNSPAASGVTVIVPAFNEAETIVDTVRSLQDQTAPPDQIIVVDDCSDDDTGEIAAALGVTVIRPSSNTGSKAGAQNFALSYVETDLTMALDADTVLAPDAIETMLPAFEDPKLAAACGFVLPRRVKTLWERGRYVEYMYAFTFAKPIQDYFDKPLISSGCFSVYRTEVLQAFGGWPTRTAAEDMDLTWSFYEAGWKVRFIPEAVCYPIEPPDAHFMRKQLKRWSHGFVQNVRIHWRGILHLPYLRSVVAVTFWDAIVAAGAFLGLIPLLALFVDPLYLLGYLIDAPAVLLPVLVGAAGRKEVRRSLASYPCFFVLRIVNSWFMLKAVWLELVMHRPLQVYEKGH